MRAAVPLLMFLLGSSFQTAQAQDLSTALTTASLVAATTAQAPVMVPWNTSNPFAPSDIAEARWDRGRAALKGFAVGALVGGVGFAAANYALTESTPRSEYTVLSFVLGAVAGGAAGAVVGSIAAKPEREATGPQQVRLHVSPYPSDGGVVGLSVSYRSR